MFGLVIRGLGQGMAGKSLEFEIVNWDKYNPRADRKGHTWFRLENTIATEQKFYGLGAAHRWIAICLFAEVSKNRGEKTRIDVSWFSDLIKAKPAQIVETFQQLVTNGVFRVPTDTGSPRAGDTYERTDEHTSGAPAVAGENLFEEVFKKYPRRSGDQGKKPAFKKLTRVVTTPERLGEFTSAVENYARHCDAEKITGTKFVKQFSTFVNGSWEEWISPQSGAKPNALPMLDFGSDDEEASA